MSVSNRIKSRNLIRKSEKKKLFHEIEKIYDEVSLFKDKKIERVETDEYELILLDNQPILFKINGEIFPTLKGILKFKPKQKKVVVDSGAVKFIINGADIMSPGIVEANPNILKDELVIIIEEAHRKPIAIGKSIVKGNEMIKNKGKAVKSIHYIGDKIWKFE